MGSSAAIVKVTGEAVEGTQGEKHLFDRILSIALRQWEAEQKAEYGDDAYYEVYAEFEGEYGELGEVTPEQLADGVAIEMVDNDFMEKSAIVPLMNPADYEVKSEVVKITADAMKGMENMWHTQKADKFHALALKMLGVPQGDVIDSKVVSPEKRFSLRYQSHKLEGVIASSDDNPLSVEVSWVQKKAEVPRHSGDYLVLFGYRG